MGRKKPPTHPVEVRNLKTERPKGFSFDEAVDMLRQGYSLDRVADRTGFPPRMLEAQIRVPVPRPEPSRKFTS